MPLNAPGTRTPDQVTAESLRSEVLADEQLRDGLTKELTELEVSDPEAPEPMPAASQPTAAVYGTERADRRHAEEPRRLPRDLEGLESDLGSARRTYAAAETRLQELRSAAGYRGERLRIIDPGIVPERPSSPDLMLNLVIALIAGAVLSVGGLLLLASGAQEETPRRKPVSIAVK